MAKRKKPSTPNNDPTVEDKIEDLVVLAHRLNLPDGAFEEELSDACDMDAEMAREAINAAGLFEQLEFLYHRGFHLGRLEELIRELAAEDKE